MNLNKTTKICLVLAALLSGGVLIASASGFVTYENGNKIILWDNVRIIKQGLKISSSGIIDSSQIESGNLDIQDKDIYIRGLMGFACGAYPQKLECESTLGFAGGDYFLLVKTIKGQDLVLESKAKGINLSGTSIDFQGKLLLTNKNLIITDKALPSATSSVFATEVDTNVISAPPPGTLTLPDLLFEEGAIFKPQRIINLDLSGVSGGANPAAGPAGT
jgi:hypothetical protein